MAYDDLHQFVNALDEAGELHRVLTEVDPVLEIAEITDRVSKSAHGGKALLFERVRGMRLPVATNLFGSLRRICLAFEVNELDGLTERMEEILSSSSFFSPAAAEHDSSGSPLWLDVEDDTNGLHCLPSLKSWPHDGRGGAGHGTCLTLPMVFTRDPDTGTQNCGMYRVELFDRKSCGIHWNPASGGARHYQRYTALKERMPVAIVLGGDPSLILSAAMRLPEGLGEVSFSSLLRRQTIPLSRCGITGLMVPANAEVVIEGHIDPMCTRQGGAFGNHTGFYVPGTEVPSVKVHRVSHREDAILPATVVGRPPMEDCYLAKAMERLMLPLIRRSLPEVVDIHHPYEGIFHGAAVVSIRKSYPGQSHDVVKKMWNEGWFFGSRLLVVIDDEADPRDVSFAAWRVMNNVDWRRDVIIDPLPAHSLGLPFGGKIGIDATRKLPEETGGCLPDELRHDDSVRELVTRRWRDYGF